MSISALIARARRRVFGARGAGPPPPLSVPSSFTLEFEHLPPAGTRIYGPLAPGATDWLRQQCPEHVARVVAAADRAREHSFVLLGCGPYVPADPDRPATAAYRPIDWCLDPASGLRFPGGFPSSAWNFQTMRPGHADIKLPWELARCHQWVNLAQAWRLTGDDRYAEEVRDQVRDFWTCNPAGQGIHWTCTMDVAIRVTNWVLAYELLDTATCLDRDFRLEWTRAMFAHGEFIRTHLENTYEVTSNHYLSNVVGLIALGSFFRATTPGLEWLRFARESIAHEMSVQVLPDGADFESSIPYHRLVTELFLSALHIAQHAQVPFDADFKTRVASMVSFLADTLRPDGLMPQVGDADDGRLHVFGGLGQQTPQRPLHLFGAAAAVLDERWSEIGGEDASAECAWWSGALRTPQPSRLPDIDRHFPDAGIAVSRRAHTYLLVTNGSVGTRGFGNHKHNDLLSCEFHAGGVPWIVDPGSFVYTSNPEQRNRFRSTASHNTIQIDDIEQNEFKPEWLFRLFESAHPRCISWEATDASVSFTGAHEGFTRESGPVHERTFTLEKATGVLRIRDVLRAGSGRRRVRWRFHLAPDVVPVIDGAGVLLTSGSRSCELIVPDTLTVTLDDDWYSPSYGIKTPSKTVVLETEVTFPSSDEWRFELRPRPAA